MGARSYAYMKDLTWPINARNGSLYPDGSASPAEDLLYRRIIAIQQAMIEGCIETGDLEVIRSSSTAFLARDLARLISLLGERQLNFWGFSYGTVVGNIFAAMFPEKVGRFVLDGNVGAIQWTQDWVALGKSFHSDSNVSGGFRDEVYNGLFA